MEWLQENWQALLGSGGVGVIIVALIGVVGARKKAANKLNKQSIKSGDKSTNYQAGGDIRVSSKDEVNKDE